LKSRRFSRSFALVGFRVGAPRSDLPVDFFGGLFLSPKSEAGKFGVFGGKDETRRFGGKTPVLREIGACKIGSREKRKRSPLRKKKEGVK